MVLTMINEEALLVKLTVFFFLGLAAVFGFLAFQGDRFSREIKDLKNDLQSLKEQLEDQGGESTMPERDILSLFQELLKRKRVDCRQH